jgi:hypothetical protein
MSGFLQRLASRALGRPPAIRPIVGSSVPAERADPMPLAEPTAEEISLLPPAETGAARQRTATPKAPREAADPVPSAEHRDRDDLLNFSLIRQTRSESEADPHADHASRDGLQPQGSAAAPEAFPIADDRLAPTRAQDSGASLRAHLANSPDTARPRTDASYSDAVELQARREAPAQAVRASTRSAFTTQRRRERPLQVPAAGEPDVERITEVHVTIGRIELTAAPTADLPRRQPAVKRKAQSLEEYLARREANRS